MDKIFKKREKESNKGTYGRLAIIAGSKGMTGSACLTSMSSLRSGAGLVYLIVPESLMNIYSVKLTEVIMRGIEDHKKGYLCKDDYYSIRAILDNNKDALILGPGLGYDKARIELVKRVLNDSDIPTIVDADGLNCLSHNLDILKDAKSEIILTPHPGEMGKLMDLSAQEIQSNREYYALKFVEEYRVNLILKGNRTIVISKDLEKYINETGNPGMATAGSGDVLGGIVGGLLSQGINAFDASKAAVYIHGLAGDMGADEKTEYGLIASDILENIPYAIKSILDKNL